MRRLLLTGVAALIGALAATAFGVVGPFTLAAAVLGFSAILIVGARRV